MPLNLNLENGVKLQQQKEQSYVRPLMRLRTPDEVAVPLVGSGRDTMLPILRVGETVAKYSMLARSKNNMDWVISPVSGRLRCIERVNHPLLGSVLCAFIAVKDNIPQLETIGHNPSAMTAKSIVQAARMACIIDECDGMPLYYKIETAMRENVQLVIADGIDDTPYISSALKTLSEYGDIACDGVGLTLKALGGGKAVLAVYDSGDLNMENAINSFGFTDVVPIGGGYPAWPRFEKKYCEGRAYLRVGVQALRALSIAVREGVPQVESIVTVAGDCIDQPANIVVPTGASIEYILQEVGLTRTPRYVIIGDTMTGITCNKLNVPMTLGLRGICVMSHLPSPQEKHGCISCGRCVDVCPKGLFPSETVRMYERGAKKQAVRFGARECIGCGACSAVCPSGIEVSDIMQELRQTMDIKA